MDQVGKWLIFAGVLLLVIGLIVRFLPDFPLPGRLPGDIYIKKGNFHFYFPVVTGIIISVFLTLIMWIIRWFRSGQ